MMTALALEACATSQGPRSGGGGGPPATAPSEGRDFVTDLAQGAFDSAAARFVEHKVTAQQLSAIWGALTAQSGSFVSIERVDSDARSPYRLDFVTCAFAQRRIGIQVTVDASGRVAGLFFVPANEGLARAAIHLLARADFAGFAAMMSPQVPAKPSEIEAAWKAVTDQVGHLVQILKATEQEGILVAECRFERAEKRPLAVAFDRDNKITGIQLLEAESPWSAPPYVDPTAFDEQAVTIGPKQLAGAIDHPHTPSTFPAVVMITGSGPNDMDESLGTIKAFKDIAQGLASRGVLTLRMEKRTHKGIPVKTVVDEYIEDANAAVERVSKIPGVSRVVLLGHSMGASLAPRIAQANPAVGGLIMLAPSSWSFSKVIVEQVAYQRQKGFGGPEIDDILAGVRRAAQQIDDPGLKPDDTVTVLGSIAPGSYFLDLRTYHAVEVASALRIPTYIGWGDLDLKVIPDDFAGWKAIEKRPGLTLKTYAGLQHMFTPVGTAQVDHVDPAVIDDLARWLTQ
jgi:pimeloyl-ACP methyl ester carboxylesterase